jgi:hypothetical protein
MRHSQQLIFTNGSVNGKLSHLSLPVDTSMAILKVLEQPTLATDVVWIPQMVYGDFVQRALYLPKTVV